MIHISTLYDTHKQTMIHISTLYDIHKCTKNTPIYTI
jgi:hypothetical protein